MRDELKHPDSPRYVYRIEDRRGVIYVGVTHDFDKRAKQHLCSNTPIGRYVKEKLAKGVQLRMRLEEKVTYSEAATAERRAIEKYASRRLLNLMCNKKALMRERIRKHRERLSQ